VEVDVKKSEPFGSRQTTPYLESTPGILILDMTLVGYDKLRRNAIVGNCTCDEISQNVNSI
jgi:hypothetical protein